MKIQIVERFCSDGSQVFDLELGETVLHAQSERDAMDLATKIQRAIEEHTVDMLEWQSW